MASPSRCLIDGSLLVKLVKGGTLEELCRTHRVSVGALTIGRARDSCLRKGPQSWLEEAERLISDARIEVVTASALELREVVRWLGGFAISGGELELLALGLAGRGEVWTEDPAVWRGMVELGIDLVGEVGCSESVASRARLMPRLDRFLKPSPNAE